METLSWLFAVSYNIFHLTHTGLIQLAPAHAPIPSGHSPNH